MRRSHSAMEGNVCLGLVVVLVMLSASLPGAAVANSDSQLIRERRSFKALSAKKVPIIGSFFTGKKLPIVGSIFGGEEVPEIPHLGQYPLWKVHKYHGISLRPVPFPRENGPSQHPATPLLPGEAPSIVNVPNPNFAENTVTPPPTEYSLPFNAAPQSPQVNPPNFYPSSNIPSGPYPPNNSPSGLYTPPPPPPPTEYSNPHNQVPQSPQEYPPNYYPSSNIPSGSNPPNNSPSGLYTPPPPPTEYNNLYNQAPQSPQEYPPNSNPSSNIPSGPYLPIKFPSSPYPPSSNPAEPYYPSQPPTEPHDVVYNAQLPPRTQRGPVSSASATATASSTGFSSSSAFASANADSSAGQNLGLLQNVLPPQFYQIMQNYISTPEGRERVNALIGIAANARKLKTNAASSIQGMFQTLFGGGGGSTNIALQSGTYTNIPETYPEPQGVLNQFRLVGTGISGSALPPLPEVPPLPAVPGLQALPPTPGLPHIHLPDISQVPAGYAGGRYVSISLPQPPALPPPQQGVQEQPAPVETYRPPFQTSGASAESYTVNAQTYNTPQISSTSYGVPSGPVYPYQSSGGSAATPYNAPQQSRADADSFSAGSEVQEQTEPFEGEVVNESLAPAKTTKLHQVQNSQSFQGEDMRFYLDKHHPAAFNPSQELQVEDNLKQQPIKSKD